MFVLGWVTAIIVLYLIYGELAIKRDNHTLEILLLLAICKPIQSGTVLYGVLVYN